MSEIQDNVEKVDNNSVDAGLINKLNAGEIKISDLSESQRDQIMQSQGVVEAPSQATQTDLVEPKVEQPQVESQIEEQPKKPDLGEKYRQKADELNTYRQKYSSLERKQLEHERKLKEDPYYRESYLKQLGLSTEAPKPSIDPDFDVYDESNLKALAENQKRLEEELNYFKAAKQQEIEAERRKYELDRTFRNIEELQNEFPQLKTSKSFKELNDEYVNFSNRIGLENVDKVLTDANYRQQLTNQGVTVPQDLDKVVKILEINQTKQQMNYPTLRSAYLDTNDFRSSLQQQQQSTQQTVYQNGMEMVVDKVNEMNSQVPTAPSTGSESMVDNNQMTQEYMMNWMRTNNDPSKYTDADRQVWSRIQEQISGAMGG